MSNPTAPPEAQDYLLWCIDRRGWLTGLSSAAVVQEPDRAARWSGDIARGVASGLRYLRAVPLSDALRDGPPVETGEPKPGEVWRNRDSGVEVNVVRVCGGPGERRVIYTRPEWS